MSSDSDSLINEMNVSRGWLGTGFVLLGPTLENPA